MNDVCIICKEEEDEYGDCLCTRGKPTFRDAIKWLRVTEIFEDHEGERLADLLKMIDTPIKKLDIKIASHPQMAAAVASLYAKYAEKVQKLLFEKEAKYHAAILDARRKYDNAKGAGNTRPWKMFDYEIKNKAEYRKLLEDLGRLTVARDFLGTILDIVRTRGDSLNKMSDDRRLKTRIDASSKDF